VIVAGTALAHARGAALRGALACALLALVACGGNRSTNRSSPSDISSPGAATQTAAATSPATAQPAAASLVLPRGGTQIFPRYRVVAYYGAAETPAMGVLGQGTPDAIAQRLVVAAKRFEPFGRPVMPAFELIVTVAQHDAGATGSYSGHADDADIERYLTAARRVHAIAILDIQPGYRSFLADVRHFERYLVRPDVSLALDPEWKMTPPAIPGSTIGHSNAEVVNQVSGYLADLVARRHLPQKLLVLHRFEPEMIEHAQTIVPRPGLAITFHADGFGLRKVKLDDYRILHRKAPFFNGFKLFYQQDINMMPPADVAKLNPTPDLITYE